MVVKVYISLTSGLKEVKKRQQKILMILDSKNIKYEILDISEPGKENEKDHMQTNATSNGGTASDPDPRHPLPPQVFNDKDYCGDFDQFELANEIDNLEVFLKLSPEEIPQLNRSTLDTSKIDENHPNGKVIENDKPDDDKENKTEDEQNQV
ncbi:CLUMA_CG006260, isoform C [Clunio marinus]|uniref:CLUMA_CG006260, isoform C n=1 Tax=Clunio marinus TaxID=568069 RepID=A0A1J1HX82_9DIPT|nr:CLUMA_CG006260, isoform C [Clunio marinus]